MKCKNEEMMVEDQTHDRSNLRSALLPPVITHEARNVKMRKCENEYSCGKIRVRNACCHRPFEAKPFVMKMLSCFMA